MQQLLGSQGQVCLQRQCSATKFYVLIATRNVITRLPPIAKWSQRDHEE